MIGKIYKSIIIIIPSAFCHICHIPSSIKIQCVLIKTQHQSYAFNILNTILELHAQSARGFPLAPD